MNGLNDFSENTELREGLRRPFDPKLIQKLPATQKRPALDYVGHAAVTDRLNKEAPGWTYEIVRFVEIGGDASSDGLPHLMAVYGYMKIGSVVRYEVGEADGVAEYGRELKGAMSDFIRRAAMRFGVALDMWAKEDLNVALSAAPGESTVQSNTGQGSVTSPRDASGAQAADVPLTTPGSLQGDPAASPSLSVVPGGTTDAAASEEATGGEATVTPSSEAAPVYLSADEKKELIRDYGSSKKVRDAFQARFGERIRSISDITCDMVEAMNE